MSDGDLGGDPDLLLRCDLRTEPVHILAKPGKPVLRVAVVGSVTAGASLLVADDVSRLYGRVVLHEPLTELHRKCKCTLEVLAVRKTVLRYLYLNVRRAVIIASL